MDHKALRTLKLLEEIDREETPSQRDLARRLGISLGLVNSFLKRLAHKGYFKVTTIPKNRVRYLLTPKGAAEKTRLTYEYIQSSFAFYRDARHKLRNLFVDLTHQGVRKMVFFGASDLAEIAYLSLNETPIQLQAVVDPLSAGENFLHHTILHPSELARIEYDRVLITIYPLHEDTFQEIGQFGISETKIVVLD